jgi:peptide/nickel transport system substrate-binding protein
MATMAPSEAATAAAPETSEPEEVQAPEQAPVILRVGTQEDTDCWNPFTCTGYWYWGHLVTEGFTDHGPVPGCPGVPRLADSWEVSEDGLTWTIHLHQGITFSDGTPVTAQSLVDFIDWWNSTDLKYWYTTSASMESVRALDDLTLQYTTADPVLLGPDYDWVWWYMLPVHIWGELDDESLYAFDNMPPIGTGPYVLVEHEPGSHIIYDARPDYYRGKPPIDRVVFQRYANSEAIVNALIAGEIQLTDPWLPPEAYDVLVSDPNVTVEEKYPGRIHELIFNVSPGGTKHPALDDPLVREAIDYAIDKDQIVEVAMLGHGVTCPTNWNCGPNYEGELNPDLVVTPHEPETAKRILQDAGYVDTDGDGIRETPGGLPLEFRLTFRQDVAPHLTMVEMISDWLKDVGIAVIPEAQEKVAWWGLVLDDRDFDMSINAWAVDIDPASMNSQLSCWASEAGSGALNFAGYCNPEMDDLVQAYMYSDDPEARWEPMFEAQRILNQDRPYIFLAGEKSIQAYRNDKFEFPLNTCDLNIGMASPQGLLNAVVK